MRRRVMKARVKATEKIVEVYHYGKPYYIEYIGEKPGRIFYPEELDLLDNDPDYWTRLEHQAAIAAMGGMCGNTKYNDYAFVDMAEFAVKAAHALVEKMKEERI